MHVAWRCVGGFPCCPGMPVHQASGRPQWGQWESSWSVGSQAGRIGCWTVLGDLESLPVVDRGECVLGSGLGVDEDERARAAG